MSGFGDSGYGLDEFGGTSNAAPIQTPTAPAPPINCDDRQVRREIPALDGTGIFTRDVDAAILVEYPDDRSPLTARSESDVHAAVCAGLASYLATLDDSIAGRSVALTRVVTDWPDSEDGSVPPPAARVGSAGIGKYADEGGLGVAKPVFIAGDTSLPGRVITLGNPSLYVLEDLQVDVYCEDKVQRAGVRRMLERGLNPVDWMVGMQLILPRYHSAVAEYLLLSAQQQDAGDSAMAGLWPLTLTLRARCPVYRAHVKPLAHPSVVGIIGVTRRT